MTSSVDRLQGKQITYKNAFVRPIFSFYVNELKKKLKLRIVIIIDTIMIYLL